MASLANVEHRNQEATVYVGNLDPTCTEKLLLELFAQVGKVKSVYMPTDKITATHNGYGFIEFQDVVDAEYAIQILNMITVMNRPLKVSKSSLQNSKLELWSKDVGANLFVGNLDPTEVDEHLLYDTFSAFGTLLKQPKIMREEDTQESKGFGFVSFDNFEASDTAIECMHGQYLGNRQILVQYAFKKDTTASNSNNTTNSSQNSRTTNGAMERHGTRAERMLAAQRTSAAQQQQQHRNGSSLASHTTNTNRTMQMMGLGGGGGYGNTNAMMQSSGGMGMTMMNNTNPPGMGIGRGGGPAMMAMNNPNPNNYNTMAPPPPPPMMMSGMTNPPGNYGPSSMLGTSSGVGMTGRGRGRGMAMTQPAWMTQQQQAPQGPGPTGAASMPPPPPPPPLPSLPPAVSTVPSSVSSGAVAEATA